MEAKRKYSNDEDNRFEVFKTVQKLMATVMLFVVVVVGCSKGDDLSPVNEIPDTSGNNEITGGANEGDDVTVTIKSMVPASPATLKFGDSIAVTYDYDVVRVSGVRIWIEPFTNDSLSQFNSFSPSPVFKGKGTETVYVSITQGDSVVVDQLKTQINTPGLILLGVLLSSDSISESYEQVNYSFIN